MPLWTSFIFVGVGLLLVLAEVFIPAGGIIGVAGLVAIIGSVSVAFSEHGTGAGAAVLLFAAIGTPVVITYALKMFPNSIVGKWLILGTSLEDPPPIGSGKEASTESWVGRTGIALTDLRPTGTARIGEGKLSVVSSGEYIERNSPLVVLRREGSRVVVRRDLDAPESEFESSQSE
jgi:membrane-bound serine protease (ClpP class)